VSGVTAGGEPPGDERRLWRRTAGAATYLGVFSLARRERAGDLFAVRLATTEIHSRRERGRPVWTLLVYLTLILVAPVVAAAQGASRPAQAATRAETKDLNLHLRAFAELLRSDVRSQKVAIITQLMEFSEAEDTAFWADLSRVRPRALEAQR
jgi:hypothetical protein